MSDFVSLTGALEGYFDKQLAELPDEVRQRIKQDFGPISWDGMNPDQRCRVTLQVDYQRAPATEGDRKFWGDFFSHMDRIKKDIETWKAVSAPTASDLEKKEARLTELRRELAAMEQKDRKARSDYLDPRSKRPETSPASGRHDYIAYPKALKLLSDRLKTTPEEIAAWVLMGQNDGGLNAYLNANELEPPPRFFFYYYTGGDYLSPLMACWFLADDIANFQPADRYITGKELIERWSGQPSIQLEAFIRAKIAEERLMDFHPTMGGTQWSEGEDCPAKETALFALSHVEAIEAEDETGKVKPSETPQTGDKRLDQGTSGKPCGVFIAMKGLTADEVSITFVRDKAESGLGANNMLEISARGETRRVALATLDLVDRRNGALNSQGAILLGMAQKKTKMMHTGRNAKKLTRLRRVFRIHLGINADPFDPYRKGVGWEPLFKIYDKRGAADERAKREAELRTYSYNDQIDPGLDSESELGADWLKENDPDAPA